MDWPPLRRADHQHPTAQEVLRGLAGGWKLVAGSKPPATKTTCIRTQALCRESPCPSATHARTTASRSRCHASLLQRRCCYNCYSCYSCYAGSLPHTAATKAFYVQHIATPPTYVRHTAATKRPPLHRAATKARESHHDTAAATTATKAPHDTLKSCCRYRAQTAAATCYNCHVGHGPRQRSPACTGCTAAMPESSR